MMNIINSDELGNLVYSALTLYSPKETKIRVGNEHDGGYIIIDDIGDYGHLLSAGIGGDIGFERAFVQKNNILCTAFDGTDDRALELCKDEPRIKFIKKNIGEYESSTETTLKTYLDSYNDIFLKMDIEGGEWPFLNSLSHSEMLALKQIVIEFHFPLSLAHWHLLDKLAQTHYLVHYHANNNCSMLLDVRTTDKPHMHIPAVFECTYVRKDCLETPDYNTEPLPTALDRTNNSNKLDLYMNCLPWVRPTA
jgi:hypothetical protein